VRNSDQRSARGFSPWPVWVRCQMLAWQFSWTIFCSWTPKPLNRWRLFWLKIFGANIVGAPFVHQRARIQIPWHTTLHDRCCLGDRANIYNLAPIEIEEGAVVAQEAYLCTGTHAFEVSGIPLRTAPILIRKGAFVGARAFILPGVTIGEGAVIGACSVVTKDIAPLTINAGNPCRLLRSAGSALVKTGGHVTT
jgi:putative colanic acid biosynthesis acetyltransferase WcaF